MPKPNLAAVIAEVNRLRAEHDLTPISKLPCGQQGQPECCPVARALSNGVQVRFYPGSELCFGDVPMNPPHVLSEFAWAFDGGEFPELIERV